ncbi:50S ribosomal protein L32 [Curtobacterium sp. RRHDQ10]|uniref:50S ribosomal protein L32 n=1 Tax=Curtobacterium phyllosphaerae TaxID=3413379 RepID=UPI003BF2C02A
MAVPKRKKSRANTHARRSQWKAAPVTLVKTVESNGSVTYSLPHRAKVVEDSAGTPLYMEYKGRKVADV